MSFTLLKDGFFRIQTLGREYCVCLMMKAIKNFKEVFNMKLKKKIAAMGAAVMIMAL